MKLGHALTSGVLVGLLSGCASSGDPREGGLLGGIQGLSSGGYEQRIREREERLAALRETQSELAEQRESLDRSRADAEQQLAMETRRLADLQVDVSQLRAELNRLEAEHGEQDSRVARLRERLETLQAGMDSQQNALDALEGSGVSDAELERRRRELLAQRKALREEYDLLMSLTLDLAR
jgi:chromosome segregation ATPase